MGERWHGEAGNTLALFPAAVLVMFVLASMAIDAALTFSAQRQLADIAAGVANDAASAFQDDRFFDDGTVQVDPSQAQDRVAEALARRTDADRLGATCTTSVVDGGQSIRVACEGEVQQLISPARFLGRDQRVIEAVGTATPVPG